MVVACCIMLSPLLINHWKWLLIVGYHPPPNRSGARTHRTGLYSSDCLVPLVALQKLSVYDGQLDRELFGSMITVI